MFVIQNYFENRKAKIQAYEEARDKWVNGDPHGYGYRTRSDYERSHPSPVMDLGFMVRLVLVVFLSLVLLAILGSLVYRDATAPPEKKETAQVVKEDDKKDGEKCQAFRKGDYVVIQYGDYEALKGDIVGGCKTGENYQVKLDSDQQAIVQGDGEDGKVDVGGKIIPVNADSNLVVIDRAEKK